jgi:Asp/Glu/hydantoin racemase
MPDRILVINPNSTDAVTCAIDDAMARTAGEGDQAEGLGG